MPPSGHRLALPSPSGNGGRGMGVGRGVGGVGLLGQELASIVWPLPLPNTALTRQLGCSSAMVNIFLLKSEETHVVREE